MKKSTIYLSAILILFAFGYSTLIAQNVNNHSAFELSEKCTNQLKFLEQNSREGTFSVPQWRVQFSWDLINRNEWVENLESGFEYFDDGRMYIQTDYDPGATDPTQRITHSYDKLNRPTGSLTEDYVFGNWQETFKTETTYDANGNEYEHLSYMFVLGDWILTWGTRDTYTYDANSWVTEKVTEINWGKGWNNDGKEIYTLDAMGYPTEIIQQVYITDRGWQDYTKYGDIVWFMYSPYSGWGQFEFYQEWVARGWEILHRETTTYDGNGGYELIQEAYEGGTYENDYRETFIVEQRGFPLELKQEEWMVGAWSQFGGIKWSHIRIGIDLHQTIVQDWESEYRNYVNVLRWDYSDFLHITVSVEDIAFDNNIRISPNPSIDMITIHFEDVIHSDLSVEIMNLTGQKVYSNKISPIPGLTSTIDVSVLPKGIYILTLRNKGSLFTEKLVVE